MKPTIADQVPDGVVLPPIASRPVPEPVRSRRRPLLLGLGIALTALGGLGAAWLATTGTGTVTVVGVGHEVRAGQVLQRSDLVSVQVATGTSLRYLPVQRAEEVVGKRTVVRLLPGSLLNPDAVADKVVPAAGQALVGLALGPGQRPSVPLDTGDRVQIVYTGSPSDTSGSAGAGATPAPAGTPVAGVVVSTDDDQDTGKTIVNVSVREDDAARIAAWASAGRVSITLRSSSSG